MGIKAKRNAIKEPLPRRIFVVANTMCLLIICMLMILPFLRVVAESLSSKQFIETGAVWFLPKGFNINAYIMVLKDPGMLRAFNNSVFVTVVGTFFNLLLTSMLAYPLSRSEFLFKKFFLMMITITLVFSAPLIPNYLLVRALGMDNTFLAVIVPGAISGFYFFVLRSFFLTIPKDLVDAARIDGCSEWNILSRIIIPMSKPALASIGLFYGVGHWNALAGPLIYLRKLNLKTLQLKLYTLIMLDTNNVPEVTQEMFSSITIKMATLVIATIPILIVYPFLQKYFVKGSNLGSIKE